MATITETGAPVLLMCPFVFSIFFDVFMGLQVNRLCFLRCWLGR